LTDADSPIDERDRRGLSARVTDQGLHFARSANVLRVGMPWPMMVDSGATIGRPTGCAAATGALRVNQESA